VNECTFPAEHSPESQSMPATVEMHASLSIHGKGVGCVLRDSSVETQIGYRLLRVL